MWGLTVLIILGYITMGVLVGSATAYITNRIDKDQPLSRNDARWVAAFSVFWPGWCSLMAVYWLIWCVVQGVMQSGKLFGGYVTYLMNLGVPRDERELTP